VGATQFSISISISVYLSPFSDGWRNKKVVCDIQNVGNHEKHDEQVEQLHNGAKHGIIFGITLDGCSKNAENA
jgi:hypothetical protein